MADVNPSILRLVASNSGSVADALISPPGAVMLGLAQAGILDVQSGAPGDGGLDTEAFLLDNTADPNVLKFYDEAQSLWLPIEGNILAPDRGAISPIWFGAKGDGSTEDTVALRKAGAYASATGRTLLLPKTANGTYITDFLTFTSSIHILLENGVTLKLKDGATEASTELSVVKLTASNSSLKGGTIDFNRDGQDKAAFNAAGGSGAKLYFGVHALGTPGAHIENVEISTRVINSADYGVFMKYCDDAYIDVITQDCGAGFMIRDSSKPKFKSVDALFCDADGWKIYPHGIDLFFVDQPRGGQLSVIDQYGVETLNAGTAKSNWISGISMTGVTGAFLDGLVFSQKDDRPDGELLVDSACTKSLGVSLLNVSGVIGQVVARRYSSVGLEIGGCQNLVIGGGVVDAEYMRSSLFTSESGSGVHFVDIAGTPEFASAALQPPRNVALGPMQFLRNRGPGILLLAGDGVTINGPISIGNAEGLQHRAFTSNGSFPSTPAKLRSVQVIGGDLSWNERYGAQDHGGEGLTFIGTKMNNNGQSRTHATPGTLRGTGTFAGPSAGYNAADATPAVARIRTRLKGCETQDNQTVATAKASAISADPRRIWVARPDLYHVGQSISLAGVGVAGATLVTQVIDISQDRLTLADALSTFPASAGTGTISTTGTTVTGSGTAFLSEFLGPFYITAGGETRRIIAATSDTAAKLESAFTSDLTGQAFTITAFVAAQIRSQGYGLRTTSTGNDTGFVADGHDFGAGNLTGNTSLAIGAVRTAGKNAAGAIYVPVGDWVSGLGGSPVEGTDGSQWRSWRLDPGTTEILTADIYTPLAATYTPYIIWHATTADVGNVRWLFNYVSLAPGESLSNAGTQLILVDAANGAFIGIQTSLGSNITTSAGEILRMKFTRFGGDASDTYAADAGFVGVLLVPVV